MVDSPGLRGRSQLFIPDHGWHHFATFNWAVQYKFNKLSPYRTKFSREDLVPDFIRLNLSTTTSLWKVTITLQSWKLSFWQSGGRPNVRFEREHDLLQSERSLWKRCVLFETFTVLINLEFNNIIIPLSLFFKSPTQSQARILPRPLHWPN